jgi:hypothetical protein
VELRIITKPNMIMGLKIPAIHGVEQQYISGKLNPVIGLQNKEITMTKAKKIKIKQYILKNIGDYLDIRIGSDGKVTGRKHGLRVFIGLDNEFLAYIKEGMK